LTNIPRSFLRSRHVCVLSARHCLGPGDHSGDRDGLGPHGTSVPGAMPPLAATVATDGSPPRVTVSACSPVLREVCPGHVIHGSAFHRLHGHRCCRQAGDVVGESGHRDTIHTQGWRVHAVGTWLGSLDTVTQSTRRAGGSTPCLFPRELDPVTSGWFCPLTALECRGAAPRGHAPVCSVVGEGTVPGVSRDHTSQAERLLPGTAPPGGQGLGLTTVCPAHDMERSRGSATAVY